MRDITIQDPKVENETSQLENISKSSKSIKFIEEFEKFYSNVLQCKNAKKIKIKWVR